MADPAEFELLLQDWAADRDVYRVIHNVKAMWPHLRIYPNNSATSLWVNARVRICLNRINSRKRDPILVEKACRLLDFMNEMEATTHG